MQALNFFGHVANEGNVVHAFDFVGGTAANPATHAEDDCIVWVEPAADRPAVVAIAAGMGNAIGHLEGYYDASAVARVVAGYAIGRMTSAEMGVVLPHGAQDRVLRARKRGLEGKSTSAIAEVFVAVAADAPALVAETLAPHRRWLLRGMGAELAVARFTSGSLEFGQRGSIAVYRRRGNEVASIAPLSTLEHDYARAGVAFPEEAPRGILTRSISATEPLDCSTLTATTDVRTGDVFVFATRGIQENLSVDEIAWCASQEPHAIPGLLASMARRAPHGRHQPTSAVVAVG